MITGVIKGQEGFHWCPVRNLCLLIFQMVIDQTPRSQLLHTLGEAALSTSAPSVPWPSSVGHTEFITELCILMKLSGD